MSSYLSYSFSDTPEFVSTFDELPLWSAPFGLLLLKHVELKPNLTVADIGSGTGFPLLELASRLGNSCKLYGIDPWTNANRRAKEKIKNYGLENVELIESSAEHIPLADNSVDLIVSNLGINNFEKPEAVFSECRRVLKPGGKLALTTNLFGHWKLFYDTFYTTLRQLGKDDLIPALKKDEDHRGTIESISALFTNSGLHVTRHFREQFEMRFLDGSAFLNHHFIKLGWLTTWLKIFPAQELPEIFPALEANLNKHAAENGGLTLAVPVAYMEGRK